MPEKTPAPRKRTQPIEPEVVTATPMPRGANGAVTPQDALEALNYVVNAVREGYMFRETERAKIEMQRQRLEKAAWALQQYFELEYGERNETNRRLFEGMDQAIASGDNEALRTVVGALVNVASASPLDNVGNLGALMRAMDDPDTVIEI